MIINRKDFDILKYCFIVGNNGTNDQNVINLIREVINLADTDYKINFSIDIEDKYMHCLSQSSRKRIANMCNVINHLLDNTYWIEQYTLDKNLDLTYVINCLNESYNLFDSALVDSIINKEKKIFCSILFADLSSFNLGKVK